MLASALLLCVCACVDASSVRVRICSDLRPGDEIDAVRVVLRDAQYRELSNGVFEFRPQVVENGVRDGGVRPAIDAGPVQGFPVTVVVRRDEKAAFLSIQGVKDGVEIVRFDRRVENVTPDLILEAALARSCLGVNCPVGQSCVDSTTSAQCMFAPEANAAIACPR